MSVNRLDAIVLAAGASVRFGSDKRLFPVEGVPMLQRAIAAVIDHVATVHVILRDSDVRQLPSLLGELRTDSRVQLLLLDQPERGMGSNLARAVSALPDGCDGVLVMLADLPYLQAATAGVVAAAGQTGTIVVPVLGEGGQRGHPVLFARDFFPALQQLQGDSGARQLLQQHRGKVLEVVVQDEGILRDIDTP